MTLRPIALVALVLAFSACSAQRTSAQTPTVAGAAFSEQTLTHDSRTRRYLVHDFSGGKPAPLVILMHGGGGHAENTVEMTQFDLIAKREGLIAVYPDGTGGSPGGRLLTWNAVHCCSYARVNRIDDVGFISAIIDRLVASGQADPARVYVSGMSNGGMMSHRLGRELSGKIAGIAPVVGGLFGDEPVPAGPVAAIIINGALDETVRPAGGPLKVRAISSLPGAIPPSDHGLEPAAAQGAYWAKANGCAAPVKTTDRGTEITTYANCSSGADVVAYMIADNGHAWPGGKAGRAEADPPSKTFNASEMIWAFFKQHSRKPA